MSVPQAPAYDVSEVSARSPDSIGTCLMSLSSTAHNLVVLASEGAEHGGNHSSLNPFLTGGAAFGILVLMLWITTRLNRDR